MPAIGIQLYGFGRQRIDDALLQTLDVVADIGYQCIEGFPGHHALYRDQCRDRSLCFTGPHVTTADLREPGALFDYCQAMGAVHIISSGLIEWNQRSRDDYLRSTELLNASAEACAARGLTLHYHNHEFEFTENFADGSNGMDMLLAHCQEAVHFCFDLGWVARAGVDPAAFLQQHKGRSSYVHLRDFAGAQSVALGDGDIDLGAVLTQLSGMPHLTHIIVEQDPVDRGVVDDARRSMNWLQAQRF